jgi:hypothetical protein
MGRSPEPWTDPARRVVRVVVAKQVLNMRLKSVDLRRIESYSPDADLIPCVGFGVK